jgi:serine/threonine protein kinase
VASCCEALHYAHSKGDEGGRPLRIVHRDISPQNILISFDGSVKIVDFGIAKAADQASMTKSGAIKGKFAYMSPEQAAGKPLDNRADVFSIGLVLYELLTGVRPLKRESEIATLQALGFGASPVIVSVLIESMLLAALGGLIGALLAWAAFDGYRAATLNFQSFSQVTFAFDVNPTLLINGIGYALLIGFIGGLFPAIRAAGLPLAMALRGN